MDKVIAEKIRESRKSKMAGKNDLAGSESKEMWLDTLKFYQKVLKLKADKKTKPQAKKELLALDNW